MFCTWISQVVSFTRPSLHLLGAMLWHAQFLAYLVLDLKLMTCDMLGFKLVTYSGLGLMTCSGQGLYHAWFGLGLSCAMLAWSWACDVTLSFLSTLIYLNMLRVLMHVVKWVFTQGKLGLARDEEAESFGVANPNSSWPVVGLGGPLHAFMAGTYNECAVEDRDALMVVLVVGVDVLEYRFV